MSRFRFRISISLDGFVAGPDQSLENPIGVGGLQLHEWIFPLAVWREMQGLEGGEVNASTAVIERQLAGIGATVMGRHMFGGPAGPWDPRTPWKGWWGANPPFHHPVFVLTHHPRDPLVMEGGTTFSFITGGIGQALDRARTAAGGRDVALAGGANVARQYLAAGFIDEMELSVVPVLLGRGERLFDGVPDLHGLEPVRAVAAPGVMHLRFERRGRGASATPASESRASESARRAP